MLRRLTEGSAEETFGSSICDGAVVTMCACRKLKGSGLGNTFSPGCHFPDCFAGKQLPKRLAEAPCKSDLKSLGNTSLSTCGQPTCCTKSSQERETFPGSILKKEKDVLNQEVQSLELCLGALSSSSSLRRGQEPFALLHGVGKFLAHLVWFAPYAQHLESHRGPPQRQPVFRI